MAAYCRFLQLLLAKRKILLISKIRDSFAFADMLSTFYPPWSLNWSVSFSKWKRWKTKNFIIPFDNSSIAIYFWKLIIPIYVDVLNNTKLPLWHNIYRTHAEITSMTLVYCFFLQLLLTLTYPHRRGISFATNSLLASNCTI